MTDKKKSSNGPSRPSTCLNRKRDALPVEEFGYTEAQAAKRVIERAEGSNNRGPILALIRVDRHHSRWAWLGANRGAR